MSASVAIPSGPSGAAVAAPAARPSFVGILRGELFKITRQRAVWVATILLGGLLCAPYLVYLAGRGIGDAINATPLDVMYTLMQRDLQVLRAFSGIYLLILAALVIGQEYQLGTIRILLGRGVGRLQLLGAKVLALVIVALAVLVAALVLDYALAVVDLLILAHGLSAFSALNAAFWGATGWYILTVAISMGATLLLGVAANVVGRSLAFGLAVGLVWFPADNIGTVIMALIAQFTNNAFWNNITGFFLGPILNALPALIVPARTITEFGKTVSKPASTLGIQPLVNVTSTQAILVIAGYCVVFAVVSIYLTWRRDVLE